MIRIRLPIHWILKSLEQASSDEIDEIITSLLKCHSRLYPQYELVVLSLPICNQKERDMEIDRIAACLKKEYRGRYRD